MTDKLKVLIDELAMITHHESTPNPVSQMLAAVLIALRELATPAVEAAEIEVVGYLTAGPKHGPCIAYTSTDIKAKMQQESWEKLGWPVTTEPLMTVAQHRRILAGVNQQAGSGWVAVSERLPDPGGEGKRG